MNWLKHAFAVESQSPIELSRHESEVIDSFCREIQRRRMITPALAFLEMSRPLNYVAAQAMHVVAPWASVLINKDQYRILSEFLERRGSIDILCRKLEALDGDAQIGS